MLLTQTELIILTLTVLLIAGLMLDARGASGPGRARGAASTGGAADLDGRRGFMGFLMYLLVLNVVAAFFWPILFRRSERNEPERASSPPAPPPTTPSPTPQATPEAVAEPKVEYKDGPVEVYTSVNLMIEGKGRVQFKLFTFSADYHWKKSAYVVEGANKVVQSDESVMTYLSKIHHQVLLQQDAVVCVGTASFDIQDEKDEKFEEERALNRATLLTGWLRPAFEKSDEKSGRAPELFKINLGHHTKRPDSNNQRMIIIFGVKKLDMDINIEEILSTKYEDELKERLTLKGYPFALTDYSKFDIHQAT